ncbi:MAG: putative TIM-barrel fold metal-dependent hydrolase, partial [Mycobacterium sp.]|nr:putative TIM-barrel fold metal-dependent hydrolase [Mycobacterium sp.]
MAADLAFFGNVLTVDDARPTAAALAVTDGRVVAVGDRADVESWVGPDTEVVELGDGCVMPGLIEAHGHPLMEAIVLADRIVDIRPVTMRGAQDVLAAIRNEVAVRGATGAYLNGWDPLLQIGLPEPTLEWLDAEAPDTPLVIVHNSGHKAYFNSATARRLGLNRDTPDPKGAKYGRDAAGDLDGTAEETGAVFPLIGGAIDPKGYPAMLLAECARLNKAGLTTCSEMAFDPMFRPVLDALHDDLTVRLRTYEMSTAQMSTTEVPANGDDVVRQAGIKIWVDGSPWIGNIDLSFPYEHALQANPRDDHRLRLEHVGAISDAQLQRAHDLGVTCSIFVDQIHYWGDIVVDGLFGPEHGSRWMLAGSAVATGMRISLHNDPPVTPEEPLRNISGAATRVAPSGRVLGPEQRLTVDQAIRA